MDYLNPPPQHNRMRHRRNDSLWVGSKPTGSYPIAGYTDWYKADDAAAFTLVSTTHVSAWNDETSTNNWSQGTDANRALRGVDTMNSLATVKFDGSNDFMTSNLNTGNIVCSLFIVGVVTSLAAINTLITPTGATQGLDTYITTDGKVHVDKKGISQRGISSNAVVANTPFCIGITLSGTVCRVNLNGTINSSTVALSSFSAGTASMGGTGGAGSYVGDWSETLFYAGTTLSDANADLNVSGLRAKWGV